MSRNVNLKLAVYGEGAVGKTSLVNVFIGKEVPEKYSPTINSKVSKRDFELKKTGVTFKLNIWDVGGNRAVNPVINNAFYSDVDLVLMVFDMTRPELTLKAHKKNFLDRINRYSEDPLTLIVGNKLDKLLVNNDFKKAVRNYLGENKSFLITSATSKLNVANCFELLMYTFLKKSEILLPDLVPENSSSEFIEIIGKSVEELRGQLVNLATINVKQQDLKSKIKIVDDSSQQEVRKKKYHEFIQLELQKISSQKGDLSDKFLENIKEMESKLNQLKRQNIKSSTVLVDKLKISIENSKETCKQHLEALIKLNREENELLIINSKVRKEKLTVLLKKMPTTLKVKESIQKPIFSEVSVKPKPLEVKAKPQPESKPLEVKVKPQPEPELSEFTELLKKVPSPLEIGAKSKPTSIHPEVKAKSQPIPKLAEAKAKSTPGPELKPLEVKAKTQPKLKPIAVKAKLKPEPELKPIEVKAKPQPKLKPIAVKAKLKPEPELKPIEVKAKPQSKLKPLEVKAKPQPKLKPLEVKVKPQPRLKPIAVKAKLKPEPKLKPLEVKVKPQPKLKPLEVKAKPQSKLKPIEVKAKSKPEPELKPLEVKVQPRLEPKPLKIKAKPQSEPKSIEVKVKSKLKPELKPLELKTKSQPEPKPVEVKVKLRSVSKPPIAKPKLKPGLKHSGLKAKLKPIPKLPEVKKKPKPTKLKEFKAVAKPIKRDPKIELYNKYEKKNPGKRAVYRGKETKGFLEWKEKYEKS